MSCLDILEIKPLSVTSFANIFSQSVGCLFVLFNVFFSYLWQDIFPEFFFFFQEGTHYYLLTAVYLVYVQNFSICI